MKLRTLAEVRAHTGRALTLAEALKITNAREPFCSNMILALNLMPWRNSAEDWLRLEAAMVVKKAARADKRTAAKRRAA